MKPINATIITSTITSTVILYLSCSPVFGETDQEFEQRIAKLLTAQEFKAEYREIVGYGDRALPVLANLLSAPHEGEIEALRVSRALVVLRDIGGSAPDFLPLVRRQLLAESALVRRSAVEALASIGGAEDVPALVAMLSDPDFLLRHQAVKAIGKLGDESALLALEIWQKRAAKMDESRPLEDKLLRGSLPQRIEEAKKAIRQRAGSKP